MTAFTEDWLTEHNAKMARIKGASVRPVVREADTSCQRPCKGKAAAVSELAAAGTAGGAHSPATNSPKARPEEAIQKQVAEYLDWALPAGYRWLHIPNQRGTRSRWENQLLKAMGVKAGAADVLIFTPHGRFVWIELKAPKGILSEEQKDWRDWCRSIGAPWFLCRSLDDMIEALESLQIRIVARAS